MTKDASGNKKSKKTSNTHVVLTVDEWVNRALAEAPPLTREQADAIRIAFAPTGLYAGSDAYEEKQVLGGSSAELHDAKAQRVTIENGFDIPNNIVSAMTSFEKAQDETRGEWPSNRLTGVPGASLGSREHPMVGWLIEIFHAKIAAGVDVKAAALSLALNSWFEGGVESYDRGQRDARRR